MDNTLQHKPFHMIQVWLAIPRLMELTRMLYLPIQRTDLNYITHCALGELFGQQAPHPFCIEKGDGRYIRVLGYADQTMDSLRDAAQLNTNPTIYQICDWLRLASKPMPTDISTGTRLHFEVKTCPVVRKSGNGEYFSKGSEVDVFLSKAWEINDPKAALSRESVYREWLVNRIESTGGAKPSAIRLTHFSLEQALRRTQGTKRSARTIKRPTATLSGELVVTDSERFLHLLRRGIGRHRSFGYGMLKIRKMDA